MARKKKTEGEEVRLAYDGPSIDHDELIDEIEARNREDTVRASSAGESRQKIGEFLDATNMNSQAFSICRSIMKKPDTQKALDVIMSLEKALPMVRAHVTGQGTPDMFPDTPPVEPAENLEQAAQRFAPDDDQSAAPVDPAAIAGEADDFDRHLAEVEGK